MMRSVFFIKKDVHAVVVKGKSTINNFKHLATDSLKLLVQPSKKGGKRARKEEKAMNWIVLGGHLYQMAHKFFKKSKKR